MKTQNTFIEKKVLNLLVVVGAVMVMAALLLPFSMLNL